MTIFLPLQISGTILVLALIAFLGGCLYELLPNQCRPIPRNLERVLESGLVAAVILNLGSLLWLLWAWL